MSARDKLLRSIVFWLLLSPVLLAILFPFAVMTITALKSATEVHDPNWWPREWRRSEERRVGKEC